MDVIQIHNALVTIWPGGIPREGLVYLAGMIKAIADKAESGAGIATKAQTELEQALASVALTGTLQAHVTNPETGKFERRLDLDLPVPTYTNQVDAVQKIGVIGGRQSAAPVPVAPKTRTVSFLTIVRIKDYLKGSRGRTQAAIAADLDIGLWTVKRAVWQLQKEGAIVRMRVVQGPHLYQLKK